MFVVEFYAGFICLCFLFAEALCKVGLKCNSTSTAIDPICESTESCDESTNICQCLPAFENVKDQCVLPQTTPNYSSLVDNQGNGSLVAGILIPLFLIAFVICSIYVGKRFELVKWLREKFSQRNRNYDEFMIGQDDDDDPPLV
ncbi:unnamed protein product [Ceutorhynchus assimilis]|uniref:Uncharacterized protein n=1 Tax=Ceutorhynchus assimilis TaxID=467358 RepID=A0A9N9MLL3_9CUCU|nr:unnamed protein product [Ceutorhynchus assimilis]